MLRKLFYTTAIVVGTSVVAFAQSERAATAFTPQAAQSLSNAQDFSQARKVTPSNSVNALFDVQFNYNLSLARGSGGNAAICWTGTEFWSSAWASDSMFTYSALGVVTSRFKVAGVTGTRALTWDGTYIYAGVNTATVYQIDPTTKAVISTITAPALVRGLAYDSLADGGAGGFWVSNYATDITLINRAGTTLNAIPAASHGLTAMYGIAVDNYSVGGPYIWAFDQGTSASQSDLRRINIATGIPDLAQHNVMSDVGAAGTAGLAGGLAITWGLDPGGQRSILGVLQGTPNDRLFAYELNDFNLPAVDAQATKLNFNPPFTFVPKHLTSPIFWDMNVMNFGSDVIDTLSFILNVDSSSVNLYSDTSSLYSVASGATPNMSTSGAFTPSSIGTYNVTGMVSTGSQTDLNHSNDTIRYNLNVTDSTLGLDNNMVTSSLGIGVANGLIGQKFTVSAMSFASSVTFFCNAPTAGDSVSVELYNFTSAPVSSPIATTGKYFFTAGDAANGVLVNLGFTNAPYQISAGSYFVALHEYGNNVTLGYSNFNFQTGTAFAKVPPATTWQTIESAGFTTTFLLRLNILDPLFVGVPSVYKQDVFTMNPNPASSKLTVNTKGSHPDATLSLYDIAGREVFSKKGVVESNVIDLQKFSEGIYFVRMILDGKVYSEKVTIAK